MIDLSQWRIRIGLFACCQSCGASKATAAAATGCTKGVRAGSTLQHSQSSRPKLILSIACIFSLLLVVSGNVERNPGPTINDKPTKDELIKLLSSSEFTHTWEQFACRLPSMTQGIIADIKQREPDNPMSAVAQHWLDNSTDPTWKQVMDALKEANESNLFMKVTGDLHVLESAVSAAEREATTEVEKAFRILKEKLKKHYANLNQLTRNCIDTIADKMYSEDLVTESVRRSPSYSSIYDDFLAKLKLQTDIPSLERHCQLFLDCLIAEGGPVKEEAELLADDWELEKLYSDIHDINQKLILENDQLKKLQKSQQEERKALLEKMKLLHDENKKLKDENKKLKDEKMQDLESDAMQLAVQITRDSSISEKINSENSDDDNIKIYKLKTRAVMSDRVHKISKCEFGARNPLMPTKVVMLMGAVGAGKSTLINGMVNYILGVKYEDTFRLKLICDKSSQSQAHSQTDTVTAYTFYWQEGFVVPSVQSNHH